MAYYADSRSAIHSWIAMPILHAALDPEEAQKLAINLLSTGYMPKDKGVDHELLATEVSGVEFVQDSKECYLDSALNEFSSIGLQTSS